MKFSIHPILAITVVSALFLGGCTSQDIDPNDGDTPQPVSLQRVYQRVITYDCNHNVISDQVETVQSPTQWITIPPGDPTEVADSDFEDQQTDSSAGLITGNDTFQVDYSYGALNMHVTDGLNVVNYNFYSCEQWTTDASGNTTCAQKELLESGAVTLDISYSESTLSGTQEVTECDPPQS